MAGFDWAVELLRQHPGRFQSIAADTESDRPAVAGVLADPPGHSVTISNPHQGLIAVEYYDGQSLGPVEECFFVEDEAAREAVGDFIDHLMAGRVEVCQDPYDDRRGCLFLLIPSLRKTRGTTLRFVDSFSSPGHIVFREAPGTRRDRRK